MRARGWGPGAAVYSHVMAGLRRIDDNPRVSALLETVQRLSLAEAPEEIGRIVRAHFAADDHSAEGLLRVSTRGLPAGSYRVEAAALDASDPLMWPEHEAPVERGGLLGEAVQLRVPVCVTDVARLMPASSIAASVARFGSALVVPVFSRGAPSDWLVFLRMRADGFTDDEVEQHLLTGNLVEGSLRALTSVQEIRQLNRALTMQFEQVARIQHALLPERIPSIPGLAIATSYLPSQQAGGDYYDFFQLRDGRWGILVADVSGHGAGAATVVAMLHGILHAYEDIHRGPALVLEHANAHLSAARIDGGFVTAVFAVYDVRSRRLTWSRAGHPPPRLKRGTDGRVEPLDGAATLPLGIASSLGAEQETVQLNALDTVVLYTDGVTEAFDPSRRMFGIEGLDDALGVCTGEPDCVVDTVHSALYRHTRSRDRLDDQTLVAARVTGLAPGDYA